MARILFELSQDEALDEWIEALIGGEFEQMAKTLHRSTRGKRKGDPPKDRFCCLGLAAHLFEKHETKHELPQWRNGRCTALSGSMLPVRWWLGLLNGTGSFEGEMSLMGQSLAKMNDGVVKKGKIKAQRAFSFANIAEVIAEQRDLLDEDFVGDQLFKQRGMLVTSW
jgi:hypothetical protein